jgi:hypothetical protein
MIRFALDSGCPTICAQRRGITVLDYNGLPEAFRKFKISTWLLRRAVGDVRIYPGAPLPWAGNVEAA